MELSWIKMPKKLEKDLEQIKFPYSLIMAFDAVLKELENKGFKYQRLNLEGQPMMSFKGGKENLLVRIDKDTLFVRQYTMSNSGKKRKLKALYVVDASHRTFKLV
jgi:hypothetical protein